MLYMFYHFIFFAFGDTYVELAETTAVIQGTGTITKEVVRSKNFQKYSKIIISEGPSSIGPEAFLECSSLKSIFISTSIASINFENGNTFRFLSSLEKIEVASENMIYSSDSQGILYDKKKTILYKAPNIPTINIPSTVTTLFSQCIQANRKIKTLVIPKNVQSIQSGCLYDCTSEVIRFENGTTLTSIGFSYVTINLLVVPRSVTALLSNSFYHAYIRNLEFEEGSLLDVIKPNCFDGSLFSELTLPSKLRNISSGSFKNCPNLVTVQIPASTIEIHPDAFIGCPKLSNIIIDVNNTAYHSVDGFVFSKDMKVMVIAPMNADKVIIPAETEEIGKTAIQGCTKATEIEVNYSNKNFASEGGVLYTPDFSTALSVVGGRQEVVFHENCSIIGDYAMYNCKLASSIKFNGTKLSKIGSFGFAQCTGFVDLDLMNCESIGLSAFWKTTNIRNVTFSGNKLWKIYNQAFSGSSIKYLYLPSSIKELGVSMTDNSGLEICVIPPDAPIISFPALCLASNKLREFSVPSNIQKLESSCFKLCSKLSNIDFSNANSLTIIGPNCFEGTNVSSLILPKSLVTLQSSVFLKCNMLSEVVVPSNNSLTEIGPGCFANCVRLIAFEVPSLIDTLDQSVFDGCNSLIFINKTKENRAFKTEDGILYDSDWILKIYPPGKAEANLSVKIKGIGSNVFFNQNVVKILHFDPECPLSSFASRAFVECRSLEEVSFPRFIENFDAGIFVSCPIKHILFPSSETLSILPESAFKDLSSLESLSFGINSALKSIGAECFANCESLVKVRIPSSVLFISDGAFSGCVALSSFAFVGTTSNESNLTVGSRAYAKCQSLHEFDFNRTSSVGPSAFLGSGLDEVLFTSKLEHIGRDAFVGCKNLKTIYYCGTKPITGTSFDPGKTAIVRMSFVGQFSNCFLDHSLDRYCFYHAPPTSNLLSPSFSFLSSVIETHDCDEINENLN